jgi:hypothetical protein
MDTVEFMFHPVQLYPKIAKQKMYTGPSFSVDRRCLVCFLLGHLTAYNGWFLIK